MVATSVPTNPECMHASNNYDNIRVGKGLSGGRGATGQAGLTAPPQRSDDGSLPGCANSEDAPPHQPLQGFAGGAPPSPQRSHSGQAAIRNLAVENNLKSHFLVELDEVGAFSTMRLGIFAVRSFQRVKQANC